MAALLPCLLVLCTLISTVLSHGFMFQPPGRQLLSGTDCPHCLNEGGPWETSAGNTLTWPDGAHGSCGGGSYESAGAVVNSYPVGGTITISILIQSQHGGRHMFRLCDQATADEACLAAHVLERADGTGPYTWVQGEEGGPATPSSGYSVKTQYGYEGEVYTMEYRLPAGVSCASCTLQWWWTTSNSCSVPGQPFGSDMMPCDTPQPGPYPEEFWNCADISIGASSRKLLVN